MNTKQIFAKRLNRLISHSGKKLAEISSETGIATGSLSQYQNADAEASASRVAILAKYFNVSADWLLGMPKATRSSNPNIRVVHKTTGLSEPAILSLRAFAKDAIKPPGSALPYKERLQALSKALTSRELLGLVASIMSIDTGEPGHHFDGVHVPRERYYDCRMSPDSYRAFLTTQLVMVIEAMALGKEPPLETYMPYYEELQEVTDKLQSEGRLNGNDVYDFGTGKWEGDN